MTRSVPAPVVTRGRSRPHPRCWACSPAHADGLQLAFRANADGSVSAGFDCAPRWEGYPGRVHGGVIAALLDSAMTHCLFARGERALTGQLCVRYRQPLLTARPAVVRAWLVDADPRLPQLHAELRQQSRLAATADAKFVPLPGRPRRAPS